MTSIEIKVTVPEIHLNSQAVLDRISQKMRGKTANELKALFRKTVEGWENPPDFSQKIHIGSDYCSTRVWASGRNRTQYAIVNEGSPPHLIFPRKPGGLLRFQTGYRAATRPKVIGSSSKGRFGPTVTSFGVAHPGFEGRKFNEAIAEAYADTFASDMQEAINVAAVGR